MPRSSALLARRRGRAAGIKTEQAAEIADTTRSVREQNFGSANTQDVARSNLLESRRRLAQAKNRGASSPVATLEAPVITGGKSTSAAKDFANITKSPPSQGFTMGSDGRLTPVGQGPTREQLRDKQIGSAQLAEDESRRRLEKSSVDEANLRIRQEKMIREQGNIISQPKRDRLARAVAEEERTAGISQAQAGTARGSVSEDRKQLRADNAQARLEAIGAEQRARTNFQLARAENASRQRVEGMAQQLRILSQDRAKVEQDALDFERQIETEERQAIREKEVLREGREADFIFDQVKKGNIDVLDNLSDEQLSSAGFSRDFVDTLAKTLPPKELSNIDAAASKLIGKIIRKDGTFVLGDDKAPLSFALSEADKTKYQLSYNPLTGEQTIFNPTTAQVVQRISATGRVTSGFLESDYVPGSGTNVVPSFDAPPGGFRTDRHNNPTAIRYEGFDKMFESIGYKTGKDFTDPDVDFIKGDVFPDDPNAHTIRFKNPEQGIQAAIDLIDEFSFFTGEGKQRWTHTAMNQNEWNGLSPDDKRSVIAEMYVKEVGDGSMFGIERQDTSILSDQQILKKAQDAGVDINDPKKKANVLLNAREHGILPKQILTREGKISLERDLRKEFDSETKTARTAIDQVVLINTSFGSILQDTEEGTLSPESQGILVAFQKILDPTSVVRESEYARSAEGLSLIDNLEGKVTALVRGGAGLTPEALKEFVDLANRWSKDYRESIRDIGERTRFQINRDELDEQAIFTPRSLEILNRVETALGPGKAQDQLDVDFLSGKTGGFTIEEQDKIDSIYN